MRSMTGFGQSVREVCGYRVRIDIRSVNHRYSEVTVRVPREWTFLEEPLRKAVQAVLKRGKIDVTVTAERQRVEASEIRIDWAVVEAYLQAAERIRDRLGADDRLSVRDVLAIPDVVRIEDVSQQGRDELVRGVLACAEEALAHVSTMREAEGAHLRADLAGRLASIRAWKESLSALAPEVVEQYRLRLRRRIDELLDGVDDVAEQRIAAEVAIFADRCDISEELTRLDSHFDQFARLLDESEPVGRKLDFLLQEAFREVNTIGAKASDARIASLVVEMKAELEKMREQIQNIE
ncbi:MAG: YicC family protein [Candidatus Reconcilbacillus cellulovorans]|uniref:YicC family protein n=1 Tax=Candidatus Reconcilbacillus cellulovorans TaxID=1906605 RepID=A0A2A6E422_9BACL|nr:MAG: YicC family protein [Candidatus Reconcilbacillus cellulovorans]